jgi:hypothetical protein
VGEIDAQGGQGHTLTTVESGRVRWGQLELSVVEGVS